MPKNFSNPNRLLLTLLFFALLSQRVSAISSNKKNNQETNLALAKQFLMPTCPMNPINKPAGSMMYFHQGQTTFLPNPAFKEIFEDSPTAQRKRIVAIKNLRDQAVLMGDALADSVLSFAPLKTLLDHLGKDSEASQQILKYLTFLINIHAYANIAQRAQAGNCHEFGFVTLAQSHRYFFEKNLPMPKVGLLLFQSRQQLNLNHVAPVFGLNSKHNNVTFDRDGLVKVLRQADAVVADYWNKQAIVFAKDICQPDTTDVYSPSLKAEEPYAAMAKAFYNSFCDDVLYETLPPKPRLVDSEDKAAFKASVQFILDKTKVDECQVDDTLRSTVTLMM